MAFIHNRKLIAALSMGLKEKDSEIQELKRNINRLENKLNVISQQIQHKMFRQVHHPHQIMEQAAVMVEAAVAAAEVPAVVVEAEANNI